MMSKEMLAFCNARKKIDPPVNPVRKNKEIPRIQWNPAIVTAYCTKQGRADKYMKLRLDADSLSDNFLAVKAVKNK